MKYSVWFIRLMFAAWMIPAGLNHFVPLFPQPMGSQPLSQELIVALLDSHLFDLVKAVELIAGIFLLFGFYTPLALLLCMPVSFCVFYWDAPLEGWGSIAARYGYAVLFSNVFLCLAYIRSYRAMFTIKAEPGNRQLALFGSVLLGGWMLLNGINFFLLHLWTIPTGNEPLATQLMVALVNSRLLDVAMAIQLVAGALILARFMIPAALCVLMPISTCALFWAVILDHSPTNIVMAVVVFALNGLLMLTYLPYYQGVLKRRALALGEAAGGAMNFEELYVNLAGRIQRARFIPAMIIVIAVATFFLYVVTGRTAQFCTLVLLYPATALLAGRVRDMGYSAWLVVIPLALMLATLMTMLGFFTLGSTGDTGVMWAALAVSALYLIWAGAGQSRSN